MGSGTNSGRLAAKIESASISSSVVTIEGRNYTGRFNTTPAEWGHESHDTKIRNITSIDIYDETGRKTETATSRDRIATIMGQRSVNVKVVDENWLDSDKVKLTIIKFK